MGLPFWTNFFDELQNIRGRSQNTVAAYRRDLDLYREFLEKHKGDIPAFYEFMQKQKLSVRTQARIISSLRTYFRFCEEKGLKCAELRDLTQKRVVLPLPKVLSVQDFGTLFAASVVEDPLKTRRNKLLLLFLYGIGCRVSEMIQIDLDDFSLTGNWIKLLGKGNKERLVPISERLTLELKSYLEEVRPQLVKDSNKSIIVNDRGHRPSRVDIWRWVALWSEKAGFPKAYGPHKFRHGCATALLENGADLRTIQILLGHSSIQSTQIYTSVTTNTMAATIKDHHPFSKLEDVVSPMPLLITTE